MDMPFRGFFTLKANMKRESTKVSGISIPVRGVRQAINPQSRLEDSLYNASSLKELYGLILENSGKATTVTQKYPTEPLRWKHAYFFFRGLRHIQFLQGRSGMHIGMDPALQ